jgi:hypothetical protein
LVATPREKRLSAAITLATIALCAFFLAQGTTRVLASELLESDSTATTAKGRPVATTTPAFQRKRDPAIILRRNIFDSARGDLTAEPLPEVQVGPDGEPLEEWDPSQPTQKCSSKLRLVGSVMSPGYPEWSFAAIAGASDGKTMLYREGSNVDGSRVLAVYSSSVIVAGSSGACELLMFEEDEGVAARPVAPVAKPAPKPAEKSLPKASRKSAIPSSTSNAAWSTKSWRIREA